MLVSLIVFAPFVGGLLLGILYIFNSKIKLSQTSFAILGVSAPILSSVLSLVLFFSWQEPFKATLFSWIFVHNFTVNVSFYIDRLSLLMTVFVTFLAALIHLYSIGYMDKDKGFGKFFSYMNLFLGAMLMLVLADNPLLMFMGWEGVGICSYLLIAFYFTNSQNVKAGNKAFIINRVGDFGFVVGMISLYIAIGAFGFDFLSLEQNINQVTPTLLTFIALALFVGATGKSAQIPLYTWLPDAMAGPTPISALIHAATMVTAGVYMIVRFSFLYSNVPFVLELIGTVGALSALLAAIIATKQTDIKKILAYSTMSQLGYMFSALSGGGYQEAMFHLFTHGFFKALLFLGAGAVIVALHHEQDVFKMGGLRRLKIIYYPMLIATLAISGIFPFAGFFSKDAILMHALLSGNYFIFAVLLFTALLTSYYMFRLFFLVFHGKKSTHKTEKTPFNMSIVLVVLSFGAVFGGSFSSLLSSLGFENLHASLNAEIFVITASTLAGLIGIFIAYKKFFVYDYKLRSENKFEYLVKNLFFVDKFQELIFVQNLVRMSEFFYGYIDRKIIYKITQKSGSGFRLFGVFYSKKSQDGVANKYAFYMIFVLCVMVIYLKVWHWNL